MSSNKQHPNFRLAVSLLLTAMMAGAWYWQSTDYGFVSRHKTLQRLESYDWHSAPHRIRPVSDPADAFRTRRKLIQTATEKIDIAVFLWRDDRSSRILYNDLIDACERGVKVRILGDGVFFLREVGRVKFMAQAHENLELRVYNPIAEQLASVDVRSLDDLLWRFDLTNHRFHIKFFNIDGDQTLLGGRNIGDRYFGLAGDYNFIDLDLLVEGPAVAQAENIFQSYWDDPLTHNVLNLKDVAAADPVTVADPDPLPEAYNTNKPGDEWRTVKRMAIWADRPGVIDTVPGYQPNLLADRLATLIGVAQEEVLVSTPYLVISEKSHALLGRMREQNKELQLHFLTNSLAASDNWQTYSAFQTQLQWMLSDYQLLIHLKKPSVLHAWSGNQDSISSLHTKAWVIDKRKSAVGSFNWDPRSEIFNSEVMAVIDDADFSAWLHNHLAPLSKPKNAWVVGERDLPVVLEQLDDLTNLFNEWSREITGLQAWSLSNTSCFELVGDETCSPYEEGFYTNYKSVGPFPEVQAEHKKEVYSNMLLPISNLIKPTL
ncbi:phospholipase D family protein [Kiritimatiellaeota bacterium B1221]|nr:phospholipase D family protein [Kiritimatiellaeota bacterium B1221]